MIYKYSVLKSSWGIVVFLDMEELTDPVIYDNDIRISDFVYLRFKNEIELRIKKEIVQKWVGLALNKLSDQITETVKTKVCFEINNIDFSLVDFQEEGLYCATIGWLSEYYHLQVDPINVEYNKEKNIYEFDIA